MSLVMPGFTVAECLLAIGAYLGTGLLAYSVVLEKWSVVDALYFSVVSFTTVGYGDMSPSNVPSKLFTCFYGLGGIVLLGTVISSIGTHLVNAEIETMKKAERASRRSLLKVVDAMPSILAENSTLRKIIRNQPEERPLEDVAAGIPWWKTEFIENLVGITNRFLPAFFVLIVGGMIMGRLEGWQWQDSLYYSVITAGTVGLGDFSPQTQAGRMWAILFIPLAVAAAGEVLGNAASFLARRRQKEAYDRTLHRELSLDYLLQLDANGDGSVSREEFIEGMLIELKLVDVDQLKELNEQFDRLDVNKTGTLDKDDLRLAVEVSRTSERSETS